MLLAQDIMTRTVLSVTPETSMQEAMELLLECEISGLPVVDGAGKLVGIITETDRIRLAVASSHCAEMRVEQCMTRVVVTVGEATPLSKVLEVLSQANVRRVPVMRAGRVVGIVSRRDAVRAITAKSPTC